MRPARAARQHPEWTVALLATASWMAIAAMHVRVATQGHGGGHHAVPDHAVRASGWLTEQGGWLLMVVAMMIPPALPAARRIGLTGMWCRRRRGTVIFAAAVVSVWVLFGLFVMPAARAAQSVVSRDALLVAVLLAGAGWELTPYKRRFLLACHRPAALPPRGREADIACARFGLRYGLFCAATCWALMLAMAIAGHAELLLMVVLSAVALGETVLVRGTRLRATAAIVLATTAAVVAA